MTESFRVLTFLGLIVGVYASAILFLIHKICSPTPLKGRLNRLKWMSWTLGLAGVACMAYGYFVEPYWPEVTFSRVETARLQANSQPIRIVHLSDMHSDAKVRLEDRLPALIAAQHPDLIVFSGDCVNSPAGLPNFKRVMTALAKIAPTYGVKGNWDAFIWPGLDNFRDTGVQELSAHAVKLRVRDSDVWIAGLGADQQELGAEALRAVPPNALTVFLHHYPYPDILSPLLQQRVALFCAGHVHGGQVALPFYGAILTLSKFGKMYERGLYQVGSMAMVVSRGIGMEGGVAPRVRFCARPEIAVIDLVPRQ